MFRKFFTVIVCALLVVPFTVAQTTGRITGRVVDYQTGEALIGANVLVVGTSFGAATDANGDFTINHLDPGVYQAKASYIGYKSVTISNLRVSAALATTANFRLPAQGVSIGEVQIIAKRPLVNSSNTNAIRTTTNEVIRSLPVRGIDNIIALTPGVIKQSDVLYIRGGRQDEVGYYLEGANITNPMSSLAMGIHHSAEEVYVPQDALEEIQVQAGGYTAEYGGANAGIVRSQLKTAGTQLHASLQYITDNWTFKNSKNRYNGAQNLGAYSYGYNDFEASLSGPIAGNHVKLYGLFENLSQLAPSATGASPVYGYNGFNFGTVSDSVTNAVPVTLKNFKMPGGPVPGNGSNQYTGVATLTFDYNPTIVRAFGTYTVNRQRIGGSWQTIYDNNRLPIQDNTNGVFGLKLTQILSTNAFVEVNGSYTFNKGKTYDPYLKDNFLAYGDSVANTQAGAPWYRSPVDNAYSQYNSPAPYNLFSTFTLDVPNQELAVYNEFENDNLNLSADFSDQLNKQNSLKIGGEIQMYTIRNFTAASAQSGNSLGFAGNIHNATNGETVQSILIKQGIDNYGYDVLGNSYSGSTNYNTGQIAPHRPIFAGAYVQDRLEYKNLVVNAGLRYDYINTDQLTFADPQNPGSVYSASSNNIIHPEGLVKVPAFSSLSPRLGFSFPITDVTMFHAQYGKFVQQPSLNDLYVGPYAFGALINPNAGIFNVTPTGLNLRPTRTTQYEVGFTQQIGDFASFDVTAYYKDIANQIVFAVVNPDASTGWRPYQILTNGDYATTQGVEIAFNMRRTDRFLVNGSLSYQNARGTGSNPYSDAGEYGNPVSNNIPVAQQIPQYIVPLDFNHSITGNLDIDYRFGRDDGPEVLHQFGVSLLLTFASGHPYTLGTAKTLGTSNTANYTIIDPRNRTAIEPLNSSVTPSTFDVDLNIDKSVELPSNLTADIFIQVINLFNFKNVQEVFSNSGSASSNEFFTNPSLTGAAALAKYGSQYGQLYQTLNIDYAGLVQAGPLYGVPRQIRLGIRLEY